MIPYHSIIQPTLRSANQSSGFKESEDKFQHSTPKYVLKVPIPSLATLQQAPQSDNKSKSGHKENNFSAMTFDQKKWNPDSQGSDNKYVLSQSAKKVNTENDDGSSIVEKSFTEAAQKILKIKNLELENKVSLLVIENERLTTFLNDQFQENEKLTNDLQNYQASLQDLSKNYEDKLNIVLLENEKIVAINQTLTMKNEQMQNQIKRLLNEKDEEINKTRKEWAGKYQQQINQIDEMRKSEIHQVDNRIDKLQFEKSELQALIQEQQQKLMEFQIEIKVRDSTLADYENVKVDLASKIHKIEMMSQTILAQEKRINDLESRLDIMVADNKQLHDVNEQLNQTQRILQGTMEDRQIEFDRESHKQKDFYELELRNLSNKNKQLIEEIKLKHQEQLQTQRIQIENELIKELEQYKMELETKQNELNNNLLIWQEKEKNITQENKKEIEIKDQMISTLKFSNQSLQDQMNQLQTLINKMQEDFDSQYNQKETECVKMAKNIHLKEQALKQMSLRLDEICKQLKILEEQRDELSQEMKNKNDKVKDLEMKLDIVVKDNDTLENQLKNNQTQLQLLEQRYINLEQSSEQKIEDMKIQYSLEVQAQIEQCITQYQQTIKYEQDHSEQLMKNLKKQQEKAKHFELLSEQQLNDMEKLNKRIEELIDVCEQNGSKMMTLENLLKERDNDYDTLNQKLQSITENYELQLDVLKRQMYDMGMQNEDLAQNLNQKQETFIKQDDQRKKIMNDLAEVTKQKIDQDQLIKKMKVQIQKLDEENRKNSDDSIKFKNQVYQLQQEIEEITRSMQLNFAEKEQELQNKYENTIMDLTQQLNTITMKFNDLVRKEKDNRFRLKLLKSNPQMKLPSELEDENCYETMKRKMEDQSQYLQRLILENDELKQQQYSHISKGSLNDQQKQKPYKQNMNIIKDHTTQDTDRTVRQNEYQKAMNPFKSQPVKVVPVMNNSQNILDQRYGSNRPIEREVYLGQTQNTKTEPHLYRKQSLQRF
ncbi:unnamed protein product [Paramecium pentaurelia]|uniref:Uncharacterized protein n=1 Tax=Paramecium pentaurelia TaxID=43138 RepID=A0A8S1V964_9CILI|nr:unnamed protein product [Paramecium pentaurelia]